MYPRVGVFRRHYQLAEGHIYSRVLFRKLKCEIREKEGRDCRGVVHWRRSATPFGCCNAYRVRIMYDIFPLSPRAHLIRAAVPTDLWIKIPRRELFYFTFIYIYVCIYTDERRGFWITRRDKYCNRYTVYIKKRNYSNVTVWKNNFVFNIPMTLSTLFSDWILLSDYKTITCIDTNRTLHLFSRQHFFLSFWSDFKMWKFDELFTKRCISRTTLYCTYFQYFVLHRNNC